MESTTSNSVAQDDLQSKPQEDVEEIDASEPVKQSLPPANSTTKRDEPQPNPLVEDPYEWDRCTITIRYSLLPDDSVSVSVHNHKDEPIVRTFSEVEIPLPERISTVMATLRSIWPASTVSATIVLMPKLPDATERTIVTSIRAGSDTPVVQMDVEGSLSLPTRINEMLDELKATLPGRGLKHIEKSAKTKVTSVAKPAATPSSKPIVKPTTIAPAAANKSQLSLF
jgi:hypothetical protein